MPYQPPPIWHINARRYGISPEIGLKIHASDADDLAWTLRAWPTWNQVSSNLITTRKIIFTPSVDIKQELRNTAINITCYDRDGKVVVPFFFTLKRYNVTDVTAFWSLELLHFCDVLALPAAHAAHAHKVTHTGRYKRNNKLIAKAAFMAVDMLLGKLYVAGTLYLAHLKSNIILTSFTHKI